MKKYLCLIFACIMLLSVLTACGGKNDPQTTEQDAAPAEEPAQAEPAAPIEVAEGEEIVTDGLEYLVEQYPTKQEADAIYAARALAASSSEPITLRILISPDNTADFEPFYAEFEKETGIKCETYTVAWGDWYRELLSLAVTGDSTYDVFMMAPLWVPDLATAGVLYNLDEFVAKYQPEIFDPASDNSLLAGLEGFSSYDGNYYFFMSDTDVATLYLRQDWLEDAANQEAFKAKYGYDLAIPQTVDQYIDQCEFFTDADKGTYGGVYSWGGEETLFMFNSLFASQQTAFFDADMNPQINSDACYTSLGQMKELLNYTYPGTLEFDAARAEGVFADGNVYSTLLMTWAQGLLEDPSQSSVVGKVTYAAFPGTENADGQLVNPQTQMWGWGYSVSAFSKNPEAAYLYCQWMSGAAMNARVSLTSGGWYDVAKKSNYNAELYPNILVSNGGAYMEDWMAVQTWQLQNFLPVIYAMRGGSEYGGVLVEGITAVLSGSDANAAMDKVAAEWNTITDSYGVDEQKVAWEKATQLYTPNVRAWLGLD